MRIPYTIAIMLLLVANLIHGQGCSDAGICSIPGFRPGTYSGDTLNGIRNFGMTVGVGDQNILSVNPYISASRFWGNKFGYDFRASLGMNTGNGITVIQGGDANLNLQYRASRFAALTAGVKIPLANAKRKHEGKPLPMDYQTSLGTIDLITGITLRTNSWLFVLAYQQPLTQNKNEYDPSLWASDSILSSFQKTVDYRRKGDIMARIAYPFSLSERMKFTAGLVPIFHLGEDEYYEEGIGFQPIIGSDGLTLNASLYFEWKLKENKALGITMGFPLVVRDVRPDGLTRSFVLGMEYKIFN